MSGSDSNNTSNVNPFTKKSSPKASGGNPFNVKVLNEGDEGLKREFFERKQELSENQSKKNDEQ